MQLAHLISDQLRRLFVWFARFALFTPNNPFIHPFSFSLFPFPLSPFPFPLSLFRFWLPLKFQVSYHTPYCAHCQ